jgi:hypothetical protein
VQVTGRELPKRDGIHFESKIEIEN